MESLFIGNGTLNIGYIAYLTSKFCRQIFSLEPHKLVGTRGRGLSLSIQLRYVLILRQHLSIGRRIDSGQR